MPKCWSKRCSSCCRIVIKNIRINNDKNYLNKLITLFFLWIIREGNKILINQFFLPAGWSIFYCLFSQTCFFFLNLVVDKIQNFNLIYLIQFLPFNYNRSKIVNRHWERNSNMSNVLARISHCAKSQFRIAYWGLSLVSRLSLMTDTVYRNKVFII